ncbi:MAG: bifunctional heptose 7-phosphate kinase/heptose 1-phosphate adenyltransferase [Candidatus Ranarchaeia archaeon]
MDTERLLEIIKKFQNKSIMVIGDLMVDEYIQTSAHGISREAPVTILKINSETKILGGAGNTVNNVFTMGGKVTPVGTIGKDSNGEWLIHTMKRMNLDVSLVFPITTKPTITKTRYMVKHFQKLRIDRENRKNIDAELCEKIAKEIIKILPGQNVIIFSDYQKGFVTPTIISLVIEAARELKIPVIVDTQEKHFLDYIGATVIKASARHAAKVIGVPSFNQTTLRNTGFNLLNQLNAEAILLTHGEEGMYLFEKNEKITHYPQPFTSTIYDITGIRDILSAALALSIACKATYTEATTISNFAAGAKNNKSGTVAITKKEIEENVLRNQKYLELITDRQV